MTDSPYDPSRSGQVVLGDPNILNVTRIEFAHPTGRVDGDLDVAPKRIRCGTERGGLVHCSFERRLVERLDTRTHGERNLGDARRSLNLVENATRAGSEAFGWCAGLSEDERERHREARRMRGGDQLLRARLSLRGLRSRRPCDGQAAERAASRAQSPASACQRSVPDHLGCPARNAVNCSIVRR